MCFYSEASSVKMAGYYPCSFCAFVDIDFLSVHKNTKKELDEYSTILTSPLINNAYVLSILVIYVVGCLAFPILPPFTT